MSRCMDCAAVDRSVSGGVGKRGNLDALVFVFGFVIGGGVVVESRFGGFGLYVSGVISLLYSVVIVASK